MTKHAESQRQVENLRVLDTISSPGVTGVVLAKGRILDANQANYAGVLLLTTVENHPHTPFRIATWYFEDDAPVPWRQWQSGSGQNYTSLTYAVDEFNRQARVSA